MKFFDWLFDRKKQKKKDPVARYQAREAKKPKPAPVPEITRDRHTKPVYRVAAVKKARRNQRRMHRIPGCRPAY
jgi:hypothetical protein